MAAATTKQAFKYDFGPALLKKVDPVGLPSNRRFATIVFTSCIFAHLVLLALNPKWFFAPPRINMDESMSVDVNLVSDFTLKAPQETALPNAKKSEDVAVPSNLLPQLPKKFEVEDQKKVEEKPFLEEKDPKADEALAKKVVAPTEQPEVPKTKEDPNKVSQEDLMKRLAVEKLKQENKVDLQMKAQKNALAKLKEDLVAKDSKTNSGAANLGVGSIRAKNYGDLLNAAVKRNLYLPKTFEYDQAQLVTQLNVIINAKGELVDVKMLRSSGNGAYDQAVFAALQNSVPLPSPPTEIAGQPIIFNVKK
jgi:colicin import membrane protein